MTEYSTARIIMYDLRPSKQIERKLVFDTIAASSEAAGSCAGLPFIGMGGFRFVDFIVANKYLGISTFVSIEHDKGIIPRCEYNKPFNSVVVRNESVQNFLLGGGAQQQAIIWLDYECGLSENLLDELQLLTGTILPGSYVFITCKGLPERAVSGAGPRQVRAHYHDQLGNYALNFREEEYTKKRFSRTAALLLRNIVADGFEGRTDGAYTPYLRLIYADSNPMVTIGGYFGPQEQASAVDDSIARRFQFLKPTDADFVYDVGGFNLTEPERRLFNRAALTPSEKTEDATKLYELGFKAEEIATYQQLMRYVPHYFEALL